MLSGKYTTSTTTMHTKHVPFGKGLAGVVPHQHLHAGVFADDGSKKDLRVFTSVEQIVADDKIKQP